MSIIIFEIMKENKHKFPYKWTLKEAVFTKDKGKVFSCFACGGGSTMGYNLAGFDVLGCNEIDPKMIEVYKVNHNPKYAYLEPIQTFKFREDLPQELYELDILDGSPPCSSFSMAGNREKDWGKDKVFREGQSMQVLDTLFFDFIDLSKKLQPKVVVAENVKGLLMGAAKEYVRKIYREFDLAGYYVQHWLLDASKMGVPQRRERVFFIALRKDLAKPFMVQKDMFTVVPKLILKFDEPKILFRDIIDMKGRDLSENMKNVWYNRKEGDNSMQQGSERLNGKSIYFSQSYLYKNKTPGTLTSHEDSQVLFDAPKYTSKNEACKIGSYPLDYVFCGKKPHYLIGMSVPPVMTAQIASEIYNQWLSKF
jgi:DNA (cytosine-5)-methyltransferase 1